MNKGKLYIISGPSGSGKDTVLAEVFKKIPDIKFSISSITRPMRPGEIEGDKYHFISRDEFVYMLENGLLLEHNEFVGNYYGTPKQPIEDAIESGYDIIIEVDVNGAKQIREKMPDAVSIFILPPSLEVLEERLKNRKTDSPDAVAKRIAEAKGEIKRANEFTHIVVNDRLEVAVDEVVNIINQNRK